MKPKRLSNSRSLYRVLLISTVLSFMAVTFQNCSQGFQAIDNGFSEQASSAPFVQFNNLPPGRLNTRQTQVTFSATANQFATISRFECRSGTTTTFTTCTSPQNLTNLIDGGHELWVRAVDSRNNISEPVVARWSVDATPPQVSFLTNPTSTTGSTTARFEFLATDNFSIMPTTECSLDNGAYTACTSPFERMNLAMGSHTFRVRATDEHTNLSPIASYTWNIDQTAPILMVMPQFISPTNQQRVTYTFSATDDGQPLTSGFECRVDTAAFMTCTSPYQSPNLTSGNHTFEIRVRDMAGNMSAAQSSQFVVDLVAPTVQIAMQPSPYYNNRNLTVNFTVTDNAASAVAVRCRVDTGNYGNCTSNTTFALPAATAEGAHTIGIQATDAAGNNTVVTTNSFVIDMTAPVIANFTGPAAMNPSTSATFSFTPQDPTSGIRTIECQLDGANYAACTSPRTYAGLANGSHTFNLRLTDNAGNQTLRNHAWSVVPGTCQTTATLSWNAPTTNTDGSALTNLGGYRISYGTTSRNYTQTVDVPNATTARHTINGLAAGTYYFAIQAYNTAGASSDYSNEATLNLASCMAANVNFSTAKPTVAYVDEDVTRRPASTVSPTSSIFAFAINLVERYFH